MIKQLVNKAKKHLIPWSFGDSDYDGICDDENSGDDWVSDDENTWSIAEMEEMPVIEAEIAEGGCQSKR